MTGAKHVLAAAFAKRRDHVVDVAAILRASPQFDRSIIAHHRPMPPRRPLEERVRA